MTVTGIHQSHSGKPKCGAVIDGYQPEIDMVVNLTHEDLEKKT